MPLPWARTVDDIDEMFTSPSADWEFEITQLTRGSLGYRATVVTLPGISLLWEHIQQTLRSYQLKLRPGFFIGAAFAYRQRPVWKGQEINPDQVVVFGSQEQDFILHAGTLLLTVDIAPEIARPIGIMDLPAGIWNTHPRELQTFYWWCRRVAWLMAPARGRAPVTDDSKLRLARKIEARIVALLDHPVDVGPHSSYHVLRRAEAMLEANGWHEPLAVDDLAQSLGMSRRTLHRAFKEIVNMGPKSYMRLVQLHNFRRKLKLPEDNGSVTEAALDAGFDHFGRAARYYKDHFGELPRVTRARTLTL